MTKPRKMRWASHVTCIGVMRNLYEILVRKPEGNRPRGRLRHRWEDNIRTDLEKWDGKL